MVEKEGRTHIPNNPRSKVLPLTKQASRKMTQRYQHHSDPHAGETQESRDPRHPGLISAAPSVRMCKVSSKFKREYHGTEYSAKHSSVTKQFHKEMQRKYETGKKGQSNERGCVRHSQEGGKWVYLSYFGSPSRERHQHLLLGSSWSLIDTLLERKQLFRSERLVVDLGGRLDEVLQVCPNIAPTFSNRSLTLIT